MSIHALTQWVVRHKTMVVGAWLIVIGAAIAAMPWAMDQLSTDFESPGAESTEANVRIVQDYQGVGGFTQPIVLVADLPDGTTVESPMVREDLSAVAESIQQAEPRARIASWVSTDDPGFVSDDGGTTFVLVYMPASETAGPEGSMIEAVTRVEGLVADQTVGGADLLVTGRDALSQAESSGGTGVLIETLIGGLGALIVLLWVFGSGLALLPLLIAAASILGSFLVAGLVGSQVTISNFVQFLIALIGLGIAIDYSLLIVTRWREERDAGKTNDEAVDIAMQTAGHAVLFSGTTVGVSLLALIGLPDPIMRGMGLGGLIIPVVSVIAAFTLLPVVLATIGPKLDWPKSRRGPHYGHGWERWASFVIRNRWPSTFIAFLILGALLIPAFDLKIGEPRPDALNGPPEAEAGLEALQESGIDSGVLNPFEVITDGDPEPVVSGLSGVEGVRSVVVPEGGNWDSDSSSLILVLPQSAGGGPAIRETLLDLRDVTHGMDQNVQVGGSSSVMSDFEIRIYEDLPLMIGIIGLITFILLVRAFRSLLLPLKAIILNAFSVGASFGVMVMVWQWGWGSDAIWGIPSTGSITNWVPIMAFAFLFGLSMDYEVFILSRMREEWDASRDNHNAIVTGLGHTGRLVTSAALILFLAFVAMASTPETEIKIMATVLATGILLDATVVRALLVPALVSLMGHWNWWLPSWLRWLAPGPQQPTIASGSERATWSESRTS